MKGTIVIDEERCKGCGLCVTVCPKGLIRLAERFTLRGYHPAQMVDPILVDAKGECTGCLLCAVICPDVAVTVFREALRRGEVVMA